MKQFKTTLFACALMVTAVTANAQKITISKGDITLNDNEKNTETVNFIVNGDSYFIIKYFSHSIMNFELRSFDSNGSSLKNTKLEVKVGVFNNSYGIDDVIGMKTKAYALIEHLDKPAGKNTLTARELDNRGNISETEVEVMNIPFEKTMNSGFNNSVVSPDAKTLAVVGEFPFMKEQPAKFKIAIYDQEIKKIKEGEITLPGENTKNKNMTVAVANDGTVYLIKKTLTKKGETTLTIYQWSAGSDVKEYTFELTAPAQIASYTYQINNNNEIMVGGLTNERKTFSVGEPQVLGAFYFTNKGKSEKIFKTFNLDSPVENLTTRKILINGNTVFLTAEQYKEERISQPATAGAANFDYNYDYTHKAEYIIAMDLEGNKKFQLSLGRDFKVRDFDKPYYSAYYICNEKLTIVYNDQTSKYFKNDSYYYTYAIPVLVQITNDGLMQSPIVFKNELKLDQGYIIYPSFSVQNSSNQIYFLIGNNEYLKFINVKID